MHSTTPLVFLHAFPLNPAMWDLQLEGLSSRRRLVPAFPGFGGRACGRASLDAFADAVLSDMSAAGLEGPAVFVGLSMGGYVAFRILSKAPERVAALVLADTRAGADDEESRWKRTSQAERVRAEGVGWLGETLLPALLGATTRRLRPRVVGWVSAMIEQADAEGVARALEAMRDRPDSTPLLESIQVPTLVIVGEEDTLTPPAEAERMAAAVAEAELAVIPRAGHLSNLESPEAFNAALLSFLDG